MEFYLLKFKEMAKLVLVTVIKVNNCIRIQRLVEPNSLEFQAQ
jgi:hypothetical protein